MKLYLVFIGVLIMTMINSTVYAITVTSNFSDSVGDIRNQFYGVSSHYNWFNGSDYKIDADGDGSLESNSNDTWHSDVFLDSNMDYLRWDMCLNCHYSDSDDGSVNFTGNLLPEIDGVEWAAENDIKLLVIASYMPTWLADTTKNCTANINRCPPTNATKWANLVVDYIDRITQNGLYNETIEIEIWNEPDIGFLMPDLVEDHALKSVEYNIIYNETYDIIKASYPNIPVGGPALTHINSHAVATRNIRDGFLGNFSNKMDFFSFHNYETVWRYPFFSISFKNDLNILFGKCTDYGADCSRILITEWNVGSGTTGKLIKNTISRNNEYSMYIADGYSYLLNSYPENISLTMYQWSETRKYTNGIGYPEYPSKWNMVSEPDLDNELTSAYNTTKMFATYHASGNTVYNSTSTNDTIKMTTSREGESSYFAVINTNNCTVDINLSIDGIGLTNLEDLEDSTKYSTSNDVIDLGTFSAYEIKYLRNDECYWSGTNDYNLNLENSCSGITGNYDIGTGSLIPTGSGTATFQDLRLSVDRIIFPHLESQTLVFGDNVTISIG